MGFEKVDGRPFRIPVSDTQSYRQFGNSVVVPVFEAVAKLLEPYILKAVNAIRARLNESDRSSRYLCREIIYGISA